MFKSLDYREWSVLNKQTYIIRYSQFYDFVQGQQNETTLYAKQAAPVALDKQLQ